MGRAALCVVGGVCVPWFRRSSASCALSSAVPPPLVCRFRLLFRVGVSPVARRDRSDAQNCRCAAPSGVACARVPVSASRVVALVPAPAPVTRPSRPKTVCACRARSASRGRATHTVPPPRVQVPPAPLRWSRLRACARPVRHCSSCTRRSSHVALRLARPAPFRLVVPLPLFPHTGVSIYGFCPGAFPPGERERALILGWERRGLW